MGEPLEIAFHALDGRCRVAKRLEAKGVSGSNDFGKDAGPDRLVSHNPMLADLVPSSLELRLHQRHDVGTRPQQARDDREECTAAR